MKIGSITVLDTTYEITEDGFGIKYIDGLTLDQFLDKISPEELDYLAKIGMKLWQEDPEKFKDTVLKHEITPLEPFI